MQELQTTRFGKIQIDEKKIIKFAEGLPAFEDEHEFVIIPYAADTPFYFLQSVQTADLAFLMTDPTAFFENYEVPLDDEVKIKLQLKKRLDMLIFSLLTIPNGDIAKTTANLLAPIVVNQKNCKALQLIMTDSSYTTKHLLVERNAKGDDEKC